MKTRLCFKKVISLMVAILTLGLCIIGCQNLERPEGGPLLTTDQIEFYEKLYGKQMEQVLRALGISQEDLSDPGHKPGAYDNTSVEGYYQLPETVEYNGVEFCQILHFALGNHHPDVKPGAFLEIQFLACQLSSEETAELVELLFQDARALYGEPESYPPNSIQNEGRLDQVAAGEAWCSDDWYVNGNETVVSISGNASEFDDGYGHVCVAYVDGDLEHSEKTQP